MQPLLYKVCHQNQTNRNDRQNYERKAHLVINQSYSSTQHSGYKVISPSLRRSLDGLPLKPFALDKQLSFWFVP